MLSLEEHLTKFRLYLIENDLKKSDIWKIELIIAISFTPFKDDNDEKSVMHWKSYNIEIMISDEADGVLKKLFDLVKNKCQNILQLMGGSAVVFDYAQLLYYKCHKINFNSGGWYIDSPYWIKDKK